METTKLAIFSASRSCDAGLRFNGKRIVIEGHVHSNGEFRVNSGNAPDHLYATSGTIAHGNCVAVIDPVPNGSRFGGGADFLPTEGEELGWPEWFTPEQLGRYLRRESTSGGTAYRGEEIEVTATHLRVSGKPDIPLTVDADGTTVIPTGTYCATKRFTISGDNHRGEITALAPEIYVEGNGQNYAPHVDGMLFFAVPNITSSATDDDAYDPMSVVGGTYPPTPPCSPSPGREMVLNGNNYEWAGVIFNLVAGSRSIRSAASPNGQASVGAIYAYEVEINGDGFNMDGTRSPLERNAAVALDRAKSRHPGDPRPSVLARLEQVSPELAVQYRQVRIDVADNARLSFSGPAGEIREVLSGALHLLAPDKEVKSQRWYKAPERRPWRSERLRYIVEQRSDPESTLPEGVEFVYDELSTFMRDVFERAHRAFHAGAQRDEVKRIVGHVEAILNDILPASRHPT